MGGVEKSRFERLTWQVDWVGWIGMLGWVGWRVGRRAQRVGWVQHIIPYIFKQKKFYDQCWAALDFKAGGSSAINHLSDIANEFVNTCGFDVDTFPPSVKNQIRESVTREMETVAKTYISTNMWRARLRDSNLELCRLHHGLWYSDSEREGVEKEVKTATEKPSQRSRQWEKQNSQSGISPGVHQVGGQTL